MNKNEFLRKLKEDLSSLSQEERIDALKYYEEYFADASENENMNEEKIITEFESPENLADRIERELIEIENKCENIFNEEPPAAPEPPKLELLDEIEIEIKEIKKEDHEPEYPKEENYYEPKISKISSKGNERNDNALKIIILACASPVWLPLLIAFASAAFGIFMAVMGISFAVAALAVSGFIMVGAGFVSVGYGIVNMFFDFFNSLQWIGAGLVTAGVGLILAYVFTKLSAVMFKSQFQFASWTIRGITNRFSHHNA